MTFTYLDHAVEFFFLMEMDVYYQNVSIYKRVTQTQGNICDLEYLLKRLRYK